MVPVRWGNIRADFQLGRAIHLEMIDFGLMFVHIAVLHTLDIPFREETSQPRHRWRKGRRRIAFVYG